LGVSKYGSAGPGLTCFQNAGGTPCPQHWLIGSPRETQILKRKYQLPSWLIIPTSPIHIPFWRYSLGRLWSGWETIAFSKEKPSVDFVVCRYC
jgi:hypothetical protein